MVVYPPSPNTTTMHIKLGCLNRNLCLCVTAHLPGLAKLPLTFEPMITYYNISGFRMSSTCATKSILRLYTLSLTDWAWLSRKHSSERL